MAGSTLDSETPCDLPNRGHLPPSFYAIRNPSILWHIWLFPGTFYFQVRHANDFNGFTLEILACPDAIRSLP
ncbi:hypothetical protein, partial [Rhizobium sp. BK049]|uniref:hypothetical protein n=1 Tax=Rhizobium sp. BK049 TaxID=2587095 RepID=UPI001AEE61D8